MEKIRYKIAGKPWDFFSFVLGDLQLKNTMKYNNCSLPMHYINPHLFFLFISTIHNGKIKAFFVAQGLRLISCQSYETAGNLSFAVYKIPNYHE